MAVPVLGGLLVAYEVIDVFLPVLYFAVQKVKWSKLAHSHHQRKHRGRRPGSSVVLMAPLCPWLWSIRKTARILLRQVRPPQLE